MASVNGEAPPSGCDRTDDGMAGRSSLLVAVVIMALTTISTIAPAQAGVGPTAPTAAQTGGRPSGGFNIVVQRKAGGGMAFVAASTGPDGRFSASVHLQQPGDYEIFSACRAGALCPNHELVSLTVNGQPAPRGENPALRTRGRGVYTVTAPTAGSSVVIAGEVRMVAVAAPRGPSARPRSPAPMPAGPRFPPQGVQR